MTLFTPKDALDYHKNGRPGKIEVVATKPYITQKDLSLAYTPGVAEPCLAIKDDVSTVFDYTAKSNLVAVISNGTAVLGLGNIGPHASKPVMEGKGLLFKAFADIDVFDLEIDEPNPDALIHIVKSLCPTFGGINLEDIKAPECFRIERELKKICDIPVFHDDQHGTAIISGAALLNALEIVGKKIEEIRVVFSGAGAAGISCAKFFEQLGVLHENIVITDTKGVINQSRTNLDEERKCFVTHRNLNTLAECMQDADVFVGVSAGNIVSPDMLLSMNAKPIVFALANPVPEISYDLALKTRSDIIMATGRSDFPNQVNNVLGFPFIFRGALDVQASDINEEMKMAAARALAELARLPVPEEVMQAYGIKELSFGINYIIPKPLDRRVIEYVAPAVAMAAMKTGVARKNIDNIESYRILLHERMLRSQKIADFLNDINEV
ncbi:MAG: hypothetical protein KBB11_00785 [Bacteroidales bacterium]|nr:hypothetical protein [Bacteroidales bacterium]